MADKTINFIYAKEKRSFINQIKNIGLDNNGIIFGGLVRDEIIATHYREEFINNNLDFKHYWNKNYHPESIGRLLLPNDIDIYFKDCDIMKNFINDIKNYINSFNGFINIKEFNDSPHFKCFRYINSYINLNHTKVSIEILLGKTICFNGIRLKLNIDIISFDFNSITDVYTYEKYVKGLEPPFYNVDFLSNIFIMDKNNNHINIRLSNCTGTPLDTMTFSNKNKFSSKVLDDIINFRTQFIRNIPYSYNCEYINCYRIIKMIDRGDDYSWNINNLPFSNFNIKDIDNDDYRCCICLEDIDKKNINQKLISININSKNILHKKCFICYLKEEQRKKHKNDNDVIEIRCPFRNPFNFKDCYKLVNFS